MNIRGRRGYAVNNDPKQRKNSESDLYQKAYESGFNFVNGMGFWSVDPRETQRRRIMATSSHLALCMMFFIFLRGYAVQPALKIVQRYLRLAVPQNFQMSYQFAVMVSDILCLAFPCLFFLLLDRIPRRAAFPHKHVPAYKTASSVFLTLTVYIISTLCSGLFLALMSSLHIVPVVTQNIIPSNLGAAAVYVVHNTVVLAFFEELVFHGAVMQSLRRYSDVFALLASSMIYALMHLNPTHILTAFAISLCTGFLVLYTGSLWTGIFSRSAIGVLSIVSAFITENTDFLQGRIILSTLYCLILMSGVISFMQLCKNDETMFCLQNRGRDLTNAQRFGAFLSSPGMIISLIVLVFLSIQYVQVI